MGARNQSGDDWGDRGRQEPIEELKSESLGQRLRRKRHEQKLGLRETARKAGISSTYLSRIETMDEACPPAEDVIRRLAILLVDDFDELMQLAGRVPEDVVSIVLNDPHMPRFLRRVGQEALTGDDLIRWLEEWKKTDAS